MICCCLLVDNYKRKTNRVGRSKSIEAQTYWSAGTASSAYVEGPKHEQRFDVRTYVVSASQTQACATCTEVHVLQGML